MGDNCNDQNGTVNVKGIKYLDDSSSASLECWKTPLEGKRQWLRDGGWEAGWEEREKLREGSIVVEMVKKRERERERENRRGR